MNLKDLSLREKVYQCMIMRPKNMKNMETLEEYFEKYPIGGLYFSKGPVRDLVEMVPGESITSNEWIDKCKEASKYPLLICADGAFIGEDGMHAVSKEGIAASAHARQRAYEYGRSQGMQMNANDVDWILEPSLDLAMNRHVSTISGTMSADAAYTAELGVELVRGIQEQNVAATAKHFPGIGTHHVNMHEAPGHNVFAFDRWMETYGHVYKSVIDAGVKCIMTSHITLESYSTKADYGEVPIATYCKDLTIGLLKEKLGFQGVVVTDALTMGGCGTENGFADGVAAFACGADLLLWPDEEVGDGIVEAIEKGEIPMSRLDDAIERIQRFRDSLGIDEGGRKKPAVDAAFVDETMQTILQEGITLLRNELGNIPLDPNRKRVAVIPVTQRENPREKEHVLSCAQTFADILCENGFEAAVYPEAKAWNQLNARRLQEHFDYMIHLYDLPLAMEVGGAWSTHLMPMAKKIGINFSTPYLFEDYFYREKTFIQMNTSLTKHSAAAAARAVLGQVGINGRMAIKLGV